MNRKADFVKGLNEKTKMFINHLFLEAPVWLLEECTPAEYKKGQIIVRERENLNNVYILLKGTVKACEFRVYDTYYEFCHFEPVEILGGMEIFTETDSYLTTLIADTACRFLVLKKDKFKRWMKNDPHALWIFSQKTLKYLLNETRIERAYLFMHGIDRVYLFLEKKYEQSAQDGTCELKATRQQIADETGLSVKTVSRSIKQMQDENLLTLRGRKILLREDQYQRLREIVMDKVDL